MTDESSVSNSEFLAKSSPTGTNLIPSGSYIKSHHVQQINKSWFLQPRGSSRFISCCLMESLLRGERTSHQRRWITHIFCPGLCPLLDLCTHNSLEVKDLLSQSREQQEEPEWFPAVTAALLKLCCLQPWVWIASLAVRTSGEEE